MVTVYLTDDAARDLEELYQFIAMNDAPEKADYVLDQIEKSFSSLSEIPERGTYPKELQALGIHDFREVFFKPYRIIYQASRKRVYILMIADGRREMRSLLERRLMS